MPTKYQSLNVFISSAGDVEEERSIIEATIQKINNSCQGSLDLYLNDISWEKKAPLTPNLSIEKIQDIINEDLENCHIFILILFKRWGSVELGQEVSNFEREINKILELLEQGKRIMLLSYFRDFPLNPDPGYQENKLLHLKKRLEEMGLWYRSYSNPEDFKEKATHDLYQTILKYRYSTTKIKSLRKFWQLGTTDTNPDSKLVILFPPVDRSFIKHGDEESFWLK